MTLLLPASVRQHQSEVVWFLPGRQIQRDTCRESPNRRDPKDKTAIDSQSVSESTGEIRIGIQAEYKQDCSFNNFFRRNCFRYRAHIGARVDVGMVLKAPI